MVGVDPTDTVIMDGKPRPIDGINIWPMITDSTSPATREFLPITSVSLIYQERYKILVDAQPTHWFTKDDIHLPDNRTAWPCRNTGSNDCKICTKEEPCLFDLLADEEERHDISKENPALVTKLVAQLATYKPYITSASLPPSVLAKYDCVTDITQYWGNFSGPCCKPKA